MEVFFAFLIKLSIIFIGGGILSLLAFKIAEETSSIPELIMNTEKKVVDSERIKITGGKKITSKSGLYELIFPNSQTLKIFSSFKGMKVFKD